MEQKIFKIFKSIQSENATKTNMKPDNFESEGMINQNKAKIEEVYFSIDQLILMDSEKLECTVFSINQSNSDIQTASVNSLQPQSQYIQLKVKDYKIGDKEMKLMQIIDVTHHILYTEFKAQNQFISLINACVSHELRNPLNSIISKNIEK